MKTAPQLSPLASAGLRALRNLESPFPLALAAALALVLGFRAAAAETPEPATPKSTPGAEPEPAWKDLFDGKTLAGWKVAPFGGGGEVEVKDGQILLPMGAMLTGIVCTSDVPKQHYEIALEAMKLSGNDFFCGLTFPVSNAFCTLILGGWGGGVVGLSSIDGFDASENETTKYRSFEPNRWYAIRVRVTPERIEAWLDGEQVIDQLILGRRISLRPGEIESSVPLGVATYQTTAALRHLKLRVIGGTPSRAAPAKAP